MFQSRLEARWAVFFDHTDTPWCYEPDKFPVRNSSYSPDFWLPTLTSFFEVKGLWNGSASKPVRFGGELTDTRLYIAFGDIPDRGTLERSGWMQNRTGDGVVRIGPGYERDDWFPPDDPVVRGAAYAARSARFEPTFTSALDTAMIGS